MVDWAILEDSTSSILLLEVQFDSGPSDLYLLVLRMTFGEAGQELQRSAPNAIIAPVVAGEDSGFLHDGVFDDPTCLDFLSLIENSRELKTRQGKIRSVRGSRFRKIQGRADRPLSVKRGSVEQSNTSILYG